MEVDELRTTVGGDLLKELRGICEPEQVITAPSTLATYRSDARRGAARTPGVAVLPEDAEQVAAVVQACARYRTPWVVRGAGTGLNGAAVAEPGGLLIVLSRMRRILAIDRDNDRVSVEPGVTPRALAAAIAPSHIYPVQPASGGSCTLGGTIATNAAGPASGRFGATAQQVLGLDVVLTDGRRVALRRDRPGLDLVSPFIGSEGALGIAVALHLRIRPAPETVRTALVLFGTLTEAGTAAAAIIAGHEPPAALELLDALALRAAGEGTGWSVRRDAGAALLIEVDGSRESCADTLEALLEHCARHGARDVEVALDRRDRERLWSLQSTAFVATRRVASAFTVADCVVAPSRWVEVLARISLLSSEFGLPVAHVSRLSTGNLHPIICHEARSPESAERAHRLAAAISAACVEAGGAPDGEHGRGTVRPGMPGEPVTSFERAVGWLRHSFDPPGRAHPGMTLTAGA